MNFSLQIFHLFVPETSTSCMTHIVVINFAWLLQLLQFSLLPFIYKFWTFFIKPWFLLLPFILPRLSSAEFLIPSLISSQSLLMSQLWLLSKAENMFQIWRLYYSMTSTSFKIWRLNLSRSNVNAVHLLTDSLSLNSATTRQRSVSQSTALEDWTASKIGSHLLSIKTWSLWLWVFPSKEVQEYGIYKCLIWKHCNLDTQTFYVEKLTTLTSLPLLLSCKSSLLISGLRNIFAPHFSIKVINTSSTSSQKLSFSYLLLSSGMACTFRTVISYQQPLGTMYDVL